VRINLLNRTPAPPPGVHPDDAGNEPRPWYTRPGFILSGLFLLVILVLLARLLWFSNDPAPRPVTPAPEPTPATQPAAACPTWTGTPPPPPTRYGETQWRNLGVTTAPTAKGLGPALTIPTANPITGQRGQLPACYAPSPGGALLAAANWLAAGTDSALLDGAVRQLTAPSPGRDAMIHRLETDPALLNASGSTGYTFVGYRFKEQTDTRVTVVLAITNTRGVRGAVSMTVVWSADAGDWQIVPPPSGDMGDVTEQITSTATFTEWE
jgi:hypothetical protein